MDQNQFFVHPMALCESHEIGKGTNIWAFAQVMQNASIGRNCNVAGHVFIESGAIIGNNVTIKNQVLIWEGIEIQDDVFIGPNVCFTNDSYPRSPRGPLKSISNRYQNKETWLKKTIVEQGASIGAGAIITPGIKIGQYATIAAGSLVTKNVPSFSLVKGAPAQFTQWVCRCGQTLKTSLKCSCGDTYLLQNNQLERGPSS